MILTGGINANAKRLLGFKEEFLMNRDKLSILLCIIAITIPLLVVIYVVLDMSRPQIGVPRPLDT